MSGPQENENGNRVLVAPTAEGRLPDSGPRYTETPLDPSAPRSPIVAEPWNAITASFFIFIVLFWVWRLRGRYRQYPFLCCCMPILLAGGIGGTLYHATRAHVAFFLLDVVPISILGLAGAAFMAIRYWGRVGWWFVPGVGAFYVAVNWILMAVVQPPGNWRINLSYAALACIVLTPIFLVLLHTRFRYGGWVVAAVISFAIAWFFRLVDREIATTLPMGSHWLWHCFGAASTALIVEYFYLVEGESTNSAAMSPQGGR